MGAEELCFMIRLSVLITIYSGDEVDFLNLALKSVLVDQVQMPDEIVLVVDGPVFDTHEVIISKYYDMFHTSISFEILRIPKNVGLGSALAAGLLKCSGEFVARMDADDISKPLRFSTQLDFLRRNPSVDVVGSAIEIFSNENLLVVNFPETHDDCFNRFRYRDPLAHPSVMFRRSFFQKAGLYSSLRKNQDTELWFRGFLNGCIFANLTTPLLYFRFNENVLLRRSSILNLIAYLKLRFKMNYRLGFGLASYAFVLAYIVFQAIPFRHFKVLIYRFLWRS